MYYDSRKRSFWKPPKGGLSGQAGEVIGVGVHVVALPWLARATMSTAVVSDAAVSTRGQEKHLVFKCIRA
jgi:hypothetical protein